MFQKLPQKHRRPSSRAYCPVALDQQLKERFPQRHLLLLFRAHDVSVISVVENGTSRFAISQSHSTSSTRPRSSSQV